MCVLCVKLHITAPSGPVIYSLYATASACVYSSHSPIGPRPYPVLYVVAKSDRDDDDRGLLGRREKNIEKTIIVIGQKTRNDKKKGKKKIKG